MTFIISPHTLRIYLYICCSLALLACNDEDALSSSAAHDFGFMDVGIEARDVALNSNDSNPEVLLPPDASIPWMPVVPEVTSSPACGEERPQRKSVSFDPEDVQMSTDLSAKATVFERVFHAINVEATGLNADLTLIDSAAKQRVIDFADQTEYWTLSEAGIDPEELLGSVGKGAGLYGGVGIAADALRYVALRDSGAPCAVVERARNILLRDLETLHVATDITGVKGVIVRALANNQRPGDGQQSTVDLFDGAGEALPRDKNNGTWRADQSGRYPNLIWEDSCSRDMYVGWALAYATVWEAIRTDAQFSDDEKRRIRTNAKDLLDSLMVVREDGYDLEIMDADGRRTYHGILHEHAIDRQYIPNAPNGFNGLLAVGIVSAMAFTSGDPAQSRYLEDSLIDERGLLTLAETSLIGLDIGPGSNYSGFNMAFTGAWLAARYLSRASDRAQVRRTLRSALYQRGDADRQPVEQSQALYHLVFAQSELGVYVDGLDTVEPQPRLEDAVSQVRTILSGFPAPPLFGRNVMNCDMDEIASGDCIALDGTPLPLLGEIGWNDQLVAAVPVPIELRPISNYYWRSNPYAVNGQSSVLSLLPASDFRWVYWAGRLLHLPTEN